MNVLRSHFSNFPSVPLSGSDNEIFLSIARALRTNQIPILFVRGEILRSKPYVRNKWNDFLTRRVKNASHQPRHRFGVRVGFRRGLALRFVPTAQNHIHHNCSLNPKRHMEMVELQHADEERLLDAVLRLSRRPVHQYDGRFCLAGRRAADGGGDGDDDMR